MKTGWKAYTLEELSEKINYGVTASAQWIPTDSKFLRITDIQDGRVNWNSVPYCIASDADKRSCALSDGDIVFARTGATTGKSYLITNCPQGALFASYLIRVRPTEEILPQFLAAYFKTADYWNQISEKVSGSTQPGVNSTKLSQLKISIPPLEEQKQIVERLNRADRLCQTRRYARQLSDTFLQSVFIEMFGKALSENFSRDFETVEELCELVRGSSPRPQGDPRYFGGSVPRLMIADITRDGIYVTPCIDSLTEEGAKLSRPMKAGSVVMAVSGAIGLPAILKTDACIHDGFVGFRNLDQKISPIFFAYFLQNMRIKNTSQAAGAIWKNLSTDQVKEWRIPLIKPHEAEKFTAIVRRTERFRAQQREAERQAEHLFQTLLHDAFSG